MAHIKALSELLVEYNLFPTQRSANAAIKKGLVYVENLRVANPSALLVIVDPTRITYEGKEIIVE